MNPNDLGNPHPYPLTTLELAQRLEAAEARSNVACVEARAALQPEVGAAHLTVGGVAAIFDGPASPLTQTFGLGVFGNVEEGEFERLEGFFRDRSAPIHHEVSPLAHPETLAALTARGYRPLEFSTVLIRPTEPGLPLDERVTVRHIAPEEGPIWSRTSGAGWGSESPELGDFIESLGRVMAQAEGVHCFLAELDDRPVAAGALSIAGDVALLAGASTIPEARRQGAQRALLSARLGYAASQGVDLAMVVAQPGSASQRNAERQGFRTAYSRIKWQLPENAP